MELYQLRYFVAVADAGNFTRASERNNISQPSLSQQIKNLESELGHKLFHRLGRRAVPTEAGQVFLDRVRRILISVEDASKELKDSPTLERRIKVGAVPTWPRIFCHRCSPVAALCIQTCLSIPTKTFVRIWCAA